MNWRRRSGAILISAVLAATGLGAAAVPAQAAGTPVASLKVSATHLKHGEMVWFTGRVTSAGKAAPGRKLVLQRHKGSSWTNVATSTSSSTGSFSVRQRPASASAYRVKVVSSGKVSTVRRVTFTSGARSLGSRAAILSSRLGASTGSTASAKVAAFSSVRYRSYAHGMLVQVVRPSGSTRTWLVYGDILATYRKAGGPKGALGAPLADPRCELVEGGCVQRFTGGAIYDNAHTRGFVAKGTGRKVEVIAAARSQVGYRQKTFNSSKFNTWVGRKGAWCSVFQSWAAAASGNSSVIPQHARWADFLADVRAHEKIGTTPKVGALVFYDTILDGQTRATHVGLVVKVSKTTITAIEGNTSTPGDSNGRGVYQKVRPRSIPLYYAYPRY